MRNKNKKKSIRNKKGYKRHTRKLRGGASGSDIRQQLVTLCKQNNWTEYDAITQQIMRDYRNGKKDFFIHLDRNIKTFSLPTLSCLKQSLIQLQEDAIPESMPHLAYIMKRT